MLPSRLLASVPSRPLHLPGLHRVYDPWSSASPLVMGARGDLESSLRQALSLAAEFAGIDGAAPLAAGSWALHPVLHPLHFARVDVRGELPRVLRDELPVAILPVRRAELLARALGTASLGDPWADPALPHLLRLSVEAAAASGNADTRRRVRHELNRLLVLYREAHREERLLGWIARGLLDHQGSLF